MQNEKWLMSFERIPQFLSEKYGLKGIEPVLQELYGDYCYFIASDGAERFFIKWGGGRDDCAHEYKYNSRLYAINPENFNCPRFYRFDQEAKCLWMEFLESENLEDLLKADRLSPVQKDSIFRQLISIHKALVAANCVHRDIKLKNFLFTTDERLVLVDFQYAVDFDGYQERTDILNNPGAVRFQVYGPGKLKWDDAYSLLKVLEEVRKNASASDIYEEARKYFNDNLGKRVLYFPRRARMLVKRKLFKIVAAFLPIKAWRVKVQHLWLR